jgi:hypothetical protein
MLYLLLFGKERKKREGKGRNGQGAFIPPGQTHHLGFAVLGFFHC